MRGAQKIVAIDNLNILKEIEVIHGAHIMI
jgi:hypothetical protein